MKHLVPLFAGPALLLGLLLALFVVLPPALDRLAPDPSDRLRADRLADDLYPADVAAGWLWRFLPGGLLSLVVVTACGIAWNRWGKDKQLARRADVDALAAIHQTPQSLSLSSAYRNNQPVAALPEPGPVIDQEPQAPPLIDLARSGFRPSPDRVLLGYAAGGPVYGPLSSLLSTAIAGRPNQGKSTLLRSIAWQTVAAGGKIGILDPHSSIVGDCTGLSLDLVAVAPRELDQAGAYLLEELDRRLAAFRAGSRRFSPFLALLDELPVIHLSAPAAVEAAGRLVLEGRKVGLYALIAGQGLPADRIGGRLVRDALSSRYIFRTTADEARRCGLTGDYARMVTDLRPGLAVLDAGVLPEPARVALPMVSESDLLDLAALLEAPRKQIGSPPEAPQDGASVPAERATRPLIELDPEDRRILAAFHGGESVSDIARRLAGTGSGRKYTEALDRVNSVLRRVVAVEA